MKGHARGGAVEGVTQICRITSEAFSRMAGWMDVIALRNPLIRTNMQLVRQVTRRLSHLL
jgi:hypothetical protein